MRKRVKQAKPKLIFQRRRSCGIKRNIKDIRLRIPCIHGSNQGVD